MTADDDLHYRECFELRDGSPAILRLMRPDDKERLIAAFAKLERQTVYTRFFAHLKELPAGPLDRIGRIDLVRLAALVVTVGSGANEAIVGSATYVADTAPDGVRRAEVAFTIEEDVQRQGLAGRLLAALAGIARRHGIERFEAEVLSANASMLSVFRRSKLPMTQRREGGVLHIEMELGRH
ncbi:MAG: GNAT family N-acetyltransferase [Burkholderiaceae bacterium]|nr:GNAT family N-acetyltransferase [Burkholderiaceae bacterium]